MANRAGRDLIKQMLGPALFLPEFSTLPHRIGNTKIYTSKLFYVKTSTVKIVEI